MKTENMSTEISERPDDCPCVFLFLVKMCCDEI